MKRSFLSTYFPELNIPTLEPLKPDRPACSYELSFTEFHEAKIESNIHKHEVERLLQQIEELSQICKSQKAKAQKKEQKYLEQIMMLNIQLMRVRQIMLQQGQTLNKTKQEWNGLESVYNLKFEEVKIGLRRQFEEQIESRKIESKQQLEAIRSLYIEKIAALNQQNGKKLRQKEQKYSEMQQKLVHLQLYQLRIHEQDTKIQTLSGLNQRLERELQELKEEKSRYLQEANQNRQIYEAEWREKQERKNQLQQANLQLRQQIASVKTGLLESNQQLKKQLQRIEEEKESLAQELDRFKYKARQLQVELEDFKNRKTLQQQHSLRAQMMDMYIPEGCQRFQTEQKLPSVMNNELSGSDERVSLKNSKKKIKQLEQQLARLEEQCRTALNSLQQAQEQLEKQKTQIQELNQIKQSLETEMNEKNQEVFNMRKQMGVFNVPTHVNTDLIDQLRNKLKTQQKEKEKLSEQLLQAQKQINKLQVQSLQKENCSKLKIQQLQQVEQKNTKVEIGPVSEKQLEEMKVQIFSYKERIIQLESTVDGLQFEWANTEKNHNGIFRQIQSSYLDQIKMLQLKNEENQKMLQGVNEMMVEMATKRTNI